jgi:hypothetical protein
MHTALVSPTKRLFLYSSDREMTEYYSGQWTKKGRRKKGKERINNNIDNINQQQKPTPKKTAMS